MTAAQIKDLKFLKDGAGFSISGITGDRATYSNGSYFKTSKIVHGKPVYEKIGAAAISCCFEAKHRWIVTDTADAIEGCKSGYALNTTMKLSSPVSDSDSEKWSVYGKDKKWVEQTSVKTIEMTAAQIKDLKFLKDGAGFSISGITGDRATYSNGSYFKTSKIVHGKPVYEKIGAAAISCCFEAKHRWIVTDTADAIEGCASGYALNTTMKLSSPISDSDSGKWSVYGKDKKWVEQTSVKTIEMTAAQIKFIKDGAGFSISGITGDRATYSNGSYFKTSKIVHGKPVYEKIGAAAISCCFEAKHRWIVTDTADAIEGCASGYALNTTMKLSSPISDSDSGKWSVYGKDKKWVEQTSVKTIEMTAAQIKFNKDHSIGFSVSGIAGDKASKVNGSYFRTSKIVHGKPVYEKVGDALHSCFFDKSGNWMVSTTAKAIEGSEVGIAYTVEKNSPSPISGSAKWKATDANGKWVEQTSVKTVVMAAEQIKFIKDGAGFSLSGIIGNKSAKVNGSYVRTSKIVHGKPVYEKVGDALHSCFFDKSGNWMVSTTAKAIEGSEVGIAYTVEKNSPSPISGSAKWKATDANGKWVEQTSVKTVVMAAEQIKFIKDGAGFSLSGIIGNKSAKVNGSYVRTSKIVHGKPVYEKLGDTAKVCYYSSNGKWKVGSSVDAVEGGNSGWAFTKASDLPSPIGSNVTWNAFKDVGDGKDELTGVNTVEMTPAQIKFITDGVGFSISGITGDKAATVNGGYSRTSKIVHGKPMYEKIGDAAVACYFSKGGNWEVGSSTGAKEGNSSGYAFTKAANLPSPIASSATWFAFQDFGDGKDAITGVQIVEMTASMSFATLKSLLDHISTSHSAVMTRALIKSLTSKSDFLETLAKLNMKFEDLKTAGGQNAMDIAVEDGNISTKKTLIESGIFGTTPKSSKEVIFVEAASTSDIATMKLIKEKWQCSPAAADAAGSNAMDVAVANEQWKSVELLMQWKVYRKGDASKPSKVMDWPLAKLDPVVTSQYIFDLVFALDVDADHTDVLSLERPGEQVLRQIWNKVLAAFTGVVDGPPDIKWVVVYKSSKLYLLNDIALASKQVDHLKEVCEGLLLGNSGAMYADTLNDIMYDPLFESYCDMLTAAEKHILGKFKNVKPSQISDDLEVVYRNSKTVKERFDSFFKDLCKKTRNNPMTTDTLKFPYRSMQKMANSLDAQWNAVNCKDIVRGAANMSSLGSGKQFVNVLFSADDSMKEFTHVAVAAGTEKIVIVWVKNRWATPTNAGWADALINFYFVADPTKTICELQLIHEDMWSVRANLGAHSGYDKLRVVQELIKATGNQAILDEIQSKVESAAPEKARLTRVRSGGQIDVAGMQEGLKSIEGLTASATALKAANKSLNFAVTEMKAENEGMKAENEEIKTQAADTKAECDALVARVLDVEKGKAALFEQLAELTEEKSALAARLLNVEQEKFELSEQFAALTEQFTAHTDGIDSKISEMITKVLKVGTTAAPSSSGTVVNEVQGTVPTIDGNATADTKGGQAPVLTIAGDDTADRSGGQAPPQNASLNPNDLTASGDGFGLLELSPDSLDQFGFAASTKPAVSTGKGRSGGERYGFEGGDSDDAFGGFGAVVEVGGVKGVEL